MKRWCVVIMLAAALPAYADHHRCDVQGTPTFQDFPCGEDRPERNPSVSIFRRGESASRQAMH
ncbi:hypothetical protein [Modicisalibacter luteus]|uniref:hypothetical protein n=1 Tax=Modicisalibacter luteus TaxID=453962 RepID=UPI00146B3E39|nr:hypothetical protein [Halomonas lutea]